MKGVINELTAVKEKVLAEADRITGITDVMRGTGDAREAISQLATLIAQGENPIGIAAQIAAVLRRLSTAARLLSLPPSAGRPAGIEQALREAGVAAWPKALEQARQSLVQLGASRARRLPVWLLDLDLALKGDAITLRSSVPSPPGSRREADLLEGSLRFKIKVHASRKQADGSYTLEGRLFDATKVVIEALTKACSPA
jgi:hypothetical protein